MDERAAAAVRQVWQSLVEAGIPSQPLALGARPHIPLCVYESLDWSVAAKQLENFARQIGTIPFQLETVETFPGSNGVVFLAPRPSEELLEIQRRFHKDLPVIAQQLPSIIFRKIGNPIAHSQRTHRPSMSSKRSRFVGKRPFLFGDCLSKSV